MRKKIKPSSKRTVKKNKITQKVNRPKRQAVKKSTAAKKTAVKKAISLQKEFVPKTKIKVIGIGGGGCSIVNELSLKIKKIDFVAANTDMQALEKMGPRVKKFSFGYEITHGLGAGMDIAAGKLSAEKSAEKIKKLFQDVDFCILVSCLGGGTGSGAVPVFAKIVKEVGIVNLGIFTFPFKFEGQRRTKIAQDAIKDIRPHLNAVSIIPNDRIFNIIDNNTPLMSSLSAINKCLTDNIEGLIELLYLPGLINIDFSDLKTILQRKDQVAYLNTSESQGDEKAQEATKKVLQHPLYQYGIKGADRILFNIAGGRELGMKDVEYISDRITDFNRRAKIIFGVSHHSKYKNKIRITLLATGCDREKSQKKLTVKNKKPKTAAVSGRALEHFLPDGQKTEVSFKKPDISKIKGKTVEKKKAKPSNVVRKSNKKKKKTDSSKEKKVQASGAKGSPLKPSREAKDKKHSSETEVDFPLLPAIKDDKARRNALDLAKEVREMEKKMLAEEKKWETPAFLRRKTERS